MKVLIADDELYVRRMLRRMFSSRGHEAICCSSGSDALASARDGQADALVVDWELSDMSGLDVVRALRSEGDVRPIVVISGHHGREELEAAFDVGADDFVPKPLAEDIVALVAHRLCRSQLTRPVRFRLGERVLRIGAGGAWWEHEVEHQRLPLSVTEVSILHTLLESFRPVSRETIIESVWGRDSTVTSHVIDANIHRIRRKTRGTGLCIETVHGVGYRLMRELWGRPSPEVQGGGQKVK